MKLRIAVHLSRLDEGERWHRYPSSCAPFPGRSGREHTVWYSQDGRRDLAHVSDSNIGNLLIDVVSMQA